MRKDFKRKVKQAGIFWRLLTKGEYKNIGGCRDKDVYDVITQSTNKKQLKNKV